MEILKNRMVQIILVAILVYVVYVKFVKKDSDGATTNGFFGFNYHDRVTDHFKEKYGDNWRIERKRWKQGADNW
ncbi:MAG: hypothetical protein WCT85_00715 [Parachlamydiales bacterium]